MNSKEQLVCDLKNLGINEGDVLLVHSSFKGLNCQDITPDEIIDALLEAIGEEGTLLMPALSYIGVNADNPHFDVNETKTCVGIIPEIFRKRHAVTRSVHPTHSVSAMGRHKSEMTLKHCLDMTPVGMNSPFMQLPKYGGKILMLGCSLLPNTFMHGVEEYARASYPLNKEMTTYTLCGNGGLPYEKKYYTHNFKGLVQRYDRISEILDSNELKEGKALNGKAYLIDSAALLIKASEKIKSDDMFFVDKE